MGYMVEWVTVSGSWDRVSQWVTVSGPWDKVNHVIEWVTVSGPWDRVGHCEWAKGYSGSLLVCHEIEWDSVGHRMCWI